MARAVHVVAVLNGHAVHLFHAFGQPLGLHLLGGLENLLNVFGRGERAEMQETVFGKKGPLLGREGAAEREARIIRG